MFHFVQLLGASLYLLDWMLLTSLNQFLPWSLKMFNMLISQQYIWENSISEVKYFEKLKNLPSITRTAMSRGGIKAGSHHYQVARQPLSLLFSGPRGLEKSQWVSRKRRNLMGAIFGGWENWPSHFYWCDFPKNMFTFIFLGQCKRINKVWLYLVWKCHSLSLFEVLNL